MRYVVTGGCGFVGSNLAATLIARGEPVLVIDNLSRHGSDENRLWLESLGKFEFVRGDSRDPALFREVFSRSRPDAILHLAGQVAMTTSMENPRLDFETNVVGTVNLLEAVRQQCPEAAVVYASSNKVYGELEEVTLHEDATRYSAPDFPNGLPESIRLDFQTPYGCSKGAADQYMLEYARTYGLNTAVFRHSTIFGGRQFATFDQGWVGWFCRQALAVKREPTREPFTISGDGKQVRDLLFVEDAVACYLTAVEHMANVRGNAFNIGGGIENSSSIVELLSHLEHLLEVRLTPRQLPWRASDQRYFVADCGKANRLLQWKPQVAKAAGIERMVAWERQCLTS